MWPPASTISSCRQRSSLNPMVSSASRKLQKFSHPSWTWRMVPSTAPNALSVRASISSSETSCLRIPSVGMMRSSSRCRKSASVAYPALAPASVTWSSSISTSTRPMIPLWASSSGSCWCRMSERGIGTSDVRNTPTSLGTAITSPASTSSTPRLPWLPSLAMTSQVPRRWASSPTSTDSPSTLKAIAHRYGSALPIPSPSLTAWIRSIESRTLSGVRAISEPPRVASVGSGPTRS